MIYEPETMVPDEEVSVAWGAVDVGPEVVGLDDRRQRTSLAQGRHVACGGHGAEQVTVQWSECRAIFAFVHPSHNGLETLRP